MQPANKRDRLIDAAALLFHRQGLATTSLADIAKQADIPIGNVYYYFKTKEELALAALQKRREQFQAAYALLEENIPDPRLRLIEAVAYFDKVREDYTRYGCPVGRIIHEVDVSKDPVAQMAAAVLTDFSQWAARQFEQLGHAEDATIHAVQLIAGIQGAVVMAKAAQRDSVMQQELKRLIEWLEHVPNRRIQLGKAGMRASAAGGTA
jgi:TetR/AcrR family transcriptional regulator, transcriptional repressor for nem operon